MNRYAVTGSYVLVGVCGVVIGVCRAIDAGNDWLKGQEVRRRRLTRWANYWMQKPSVRLRG